VPKSTKRTRARLATLTLSALGVVYGDIGTSPLYALKEVFGGTHHPVPISGENVLGILSLVFWSLMVVVSIKYVVFILRANNKGEGGIMALMALVLRGEEDPSRARALMLMGLFGAALFYGDGLITPAISVLSAVEGLEVATPAFKPYVIPITLIVLAVLFFFQKRGTGTVGALFGPIMIVWFVTLAVLGVNSIANAPQVLAAINPVHAIRFLATHGALGFFSLGAVVLVVTGAEALYADMGHFGSKSVRLAWSCLVLPALTLNYFGQGAMLIADPGTIENPFYRLAPEWALYPLVALATVATIIASQAVISGAFSITQQAMQLGYAPQMEVLHTSSHEIGQIYLPAINRALFVGVVALVLGFGSSTSLAAAYGIAVTGTMAITTVLAFVVARRTWHWKLPASIALFGTFLLVDVGFFTANFAKIVEGGWFPLAFGLGVFVLMSTW
jgi:KUP system potassium uptake protein